MSAWAHLEPPLNVVIAAGTGCGKTMLARDFIYDTAVRRHLFAQIVVFSTCDLILDPSWDGIDPSFFRQLDDDLLLACIECQRMKWTDWYMSDRSTAPPYMLLVLEDTAGKVRDNDVVKKLFTDCRHIGISILALLQYATFLPPVGRANTSVLAFSSTNDDSLSYIHGMCIMEEPMSKTRFKQWAAEQTREPYTFLIHYIHGIGHNRWLTYKAPPRKYRIACRKK